MDLHTITRPTDYGFSFGIEPRRLAKALRDLAEDIEAGRVVPQQVRLIKKQDLADFYMQSLILRFAERSPVQQELPEIDG